MAGTAIGTIRSVGSDVGCAQSFNDAPLTRLELAPPGRRIESWSTQSLPKICAVVAHYTPSRCLLPPPSALVREMTFGRAMNQAGTVNSTLYTLTCAFDGHQHNIREA